MGSNLFSGLISQTASRVKAVEEKPQKMIAKA
jgi:hypothetical protein